MHPKIKIACVLMVAALLCAFRDPVPAGTPTGATIYEETDGRRILRLTNFKTSNGPDLHVVLIALKDASDDANFLKSGTERVELGKLKGNEGDQNYEIPAGTDLNKFHAVSIYCERFNANFGTAPLEKF